MTFDETKDLLHDIKRQRVRVDNIRIEINNLASLQSSLNVIEGRGKGNTQSPVERVLLRIEQEQLRLSAELNKLFDLEDSLTVAADTLNPVEKDIIIGCYQRAKKHYQLAEDLSYSESYIEKLKRRAIKKLSTKIKKSAD